MAAPLFNFSDSELGFIGQMDELQIINYKFKIVVFPTEMNKIRRQRRHHNLSFVICNYELRCYRTARQTGICAVTRQFLQCRILNVPVY